jgi:hypothetical protein
MAGRAKQMSATVDNAVADLQRANAELQRRLDEALAERDEALEQQTATGEVLGVINSSPGDLTPVFDAILEKAHALCGAAYGGLMSYDGEAFRVVAAHGEPRFIEYWQQQGLIRPPEGSPLGRVMRGETIAHIADVLTEDSYRHAPAYAPNRLGRRPHPPGRAPSERRRAARCHQCVSTTSPAVFR